MKKKKIIKTLFIVLTLSIIICSTVFAASFTKERLASKGKFEYNDTNTDDQVIFDSNDFMIIANAIDYMKENIATKETAVSKKVEAATLICR